jgi:hypothetical protein
VQQQLCRALQSAGKDLQRALQQIERELSKPIAVPFKPGAGSRR